MGKRGPRSRVTPDVLDRIKQMYSEGATHNAISKEVGISQTNIRRILKINGTPKRNRKLATMLTPQEEEALVNFIIGLGYFSGKYHQLKELMEQFAEQNNMKCSFTYSWRDGFVRRHRAQLPLHMIKLLSPKIQRSDDLDAELESYSNQFVLPMLNQQSAQPAVGENGVPLHRIGLFPHPDPEKEPSVWRQKPKLSPAERAVKESVRAFTKAGMTKEEAYELLKRLKVPGKLLHQLRVLESYKELVGAETLLERKEKTKGPDLVAAALTDAFREGSSGGESSGLQVQMQPADSDSAAKSKTNKRPPTKKTPEQIRALEIAFAKSQTCGDKRAKNLAKYIGLTPAQVIYWFHNTARFKRKKQENGASSGYENVTEEAETSEGGDLMETEGEPISHVGNEEEHPADGDEGDEDLEEAEEEEDGTVEEVVPAAEQEQQVLIQLMLPDQMQI